jgi:ADP-ribosylglycohydrolase
MRAPVIGAFLADGPIERLVEFVNASTRLKHRTAAAEAGAMAIALAARRVALAVGAAVDVAAFEADVRGRLTHERLQSAIVAAIDAARSGEPPTTLLERLGIQRDAVSGWILQTVPVAIYCWLCHPLDFRAATEDVVLLGGDTDTTAAIVGALVGASVGTEGIPADWLNGLADWPRSRGWISSLADRLALARNGNDAATLLPLLWPAVPLRNVLFLLIVLVHGFRRLLPPY